METRVPERTGALKVAIVNQPWGVVVPSGGKGSLGIWSAEVAGRLARHCRLLVCCPRYPGQKSVERSRGVVYYQLPMCPDRWLLRLVARAMGQVGRQKVLKLYTWNRVAQSVLDMYRGAAHG